MGKRGSASSDDLDEGVQVLNLVGVLGSMGVDTVHSATLRSTLNTNLSAVDIVVQTVGESDDNHGGEADTESLEVVDFVDGTSSHWVAVKGSHGPAERTSLLAEFAVVTSLSLGKEELVVSLGVVASGIAALLEVGEGDIGSSGLGDGGIDVVTAALVAASRLLEIVIVIGSGLLVLLLILRVIATVLHHSVVGDSGSLITSGGGALEEKGTLEDMVELEAVVLLDDLAVDVGNEEEGREEEEAKADTKGDAGDEPSRSISELELGRSLVHDGERADGTGNEEEEGRGPDRPGNRVLSDVNDELDQGEDDGAEAARDEGSHGQTSKDGTKTRALVPAPLDVAGANSSDTDTGDGRNERVGGRDVGRVTSAPHNPDRGTGRSASEGEELDSSVVSKGRVGDDTVLDRGGGSGSDSEGTGHFEDQAEDHGLAVGDGSGGNTGSPGVGDIICSEAIVRTVLNASEEGLVVVSTYWHRCCKPQEGQTSCQWQRCKCKRPTS